MRPVKHDRIEEVIHRLAAEYVRDEATSASLLTITRVELNPSGKDAVIFFTTLPEKEEDTALKFLERKSPEFKIYLRDKSRIGIMPHVRFRIDYGERNRQRLDELSNENE
ncbi:MAG: ribosome-binding factor A [Parcubacteria group bacterium]